MRPVFTVILILACFSALFLCCYAPVFLHDRQFGFRDAGHFYYPLYERVQREWNEGRWPLWEPEENAGMPLLGNPTAAVLYPGKLLFAVLPYKLAARLYIVAHSVLAFCAMLVLMRSWRISWAGSGLSALSYTFGAPILFQYCNIIYLVGAAWLPLGMHAVDRWVRLGRRWAILELAVVLGMQVLGGDPQSAFLLGIAGLFYALALVWARTPGALPTNREAAAARSGSARRDGSLIVATAVGLFAVWLIATVMLGALLPKLRPPHDRPPTPPLPWMPWMPDAVAAAWLLGGALLLYRWRGRVWRFPLGAMWLGLAISAALAIAATAAQLFPVVEFTQQTTRAAHEGTHELYAFSVEPYRLIEMIWPNLWGSQYGGNTYWAPLVRMPGSYTKIWVPSLYLGGLTVLLAIPVFALRKGPPWRVWLSAIVVVSTLGALGEYSSPIWMTRALAVTSRSAVLKDLATSLGPVDAFDSRTIREDGCLRDGDGSIYWWMATFLPGFGQFRFPAKLFTFTALGLAALAGLGWDRLCRGHTRGPATLSAILLGITACALLAVLVERRPILDTFKAIDADSMFGPFDPSGAVQAIIRCLVHTTVVLALALVITILTRIRPTLAAALMLLLSTCDLALANARFVFTVPQSLFETRSEVLELIKAEERARPSPGPFRIHRMPLWSPTGWNTTPSPDRVSDFVAWERGTLQPKYGINLGVEYTHTIGVAEIYDYEWFFAGFPRTIRDAATARKLGVDENKKVVYFPRRGFDLWNTRYFILPYFPNGWNDELRATAAFLFQTRQVYPEPERFSGPDREEKYKEWVRTKDYSIQRNEQEFPRAWVVHQVRAVKPTESLSRASRSQAIEEMLYADDAFWYDDTKIAFDPRQLAWVARDDLEEIGPRLSRGRAKPTEKVKVTYPSPQKVVLDVELESAGLVVLADASYPGWQLTIDDKTSPVYRVNGMMRGALVPADHHRLVYTFAPRSFRVGLVVSAVGIAALLLLGLGCWLRPLDPLLATSSQIDSHPDATGEKLD